MSPVPTTTSGQSNSTKRPHRRRTWTVQSYSSSGANVTPSNACFPWPTPNDSSIGSAVFAGPPNMYGSIVFARWRRCATRCNTCFLGPTRLHNPNDISIDHFCTVHGRVSLGMPRYVLSPKIAPSHGRSATPSNIWLLGHTRVQIPNGISIGSAVFAGPPNMDDSIVFATSRQCAPHVTHASLGPPWGHNPKGILIGSAIFAQFTTACCCACSGMSLPLKIAPSHGAIWRPV